MDFPVYTVLIYFELSLAPLVFILLFFITAPYGRFTRKGWGAATSSRIAWIIMEMPSLVIPLLYLLRNPFFSGGTLFSLIWLSHYFHRTLIYPFRISDPKKPFSIVILSWGFLFNSVNSFINFHFLFHIAEPYGASWFIRWRFLTGLILFVAGYIVNKHSDNILKNLRTGGGRGYAIPRGGLFRWISSPNYLGEILEWGGWAIMTWSPAGAAFFLFTIANLFPRAITNHKWYRSRFPDYPRERKAIIPYIC